MGDPVNGGLLVLRLALGAVFVAHGVKHALGREKTTTWLASTGFRRPGLQWFAMTAGEIGFGALVAAGLLTALAAAGVIGTMAVAFWTVHRAAGFFITAFYRHDVEGWEYVFFISAAALALAVTGPGEWSLDEALGIATTFDGWVGLAIGLGGLVVAAGQLALFWRAPPE